MEQIEPSLRTSRWLQMIFGCVTPCARERKFNYRFDAEEIDGAHRSADLFLPAKMAEPLGIGPYWRRAVELQQVDGFNVSVSGELPSLITFLRIPMVWSRQ